MPTNYKRRYLPLELKEELLPFTGNWERFSSLPHEGFIPLDLEDSPGNYEINPFGVIREIVTKVVMPRADGAHTRIKTNAGTRKISWKWALALAFGKHPIKGEGFCVRKEREQGVGGPEDLHICYNGKTHGWELLKHDWVIFPKILSEASSLAVPGFKGISVSRNGEITVEEGSPYYVNNKNEVVDYDKEKQIATYTSAIKLVALAYLEIPAGRIDFCARKRNTGFPISPENITLFYGFERRGIKPHRPVWYGHIIDPFEVKKMDYTHHLCKRLGISRGQVYPKILRERTIFVRGWIISRNRQDVLDEVRRIRKLCRK